MAVSIHQIAKEAGVSSSTVARALRGDTKAVRKDSIERVQRILSIAEQMGYEQSWRAKAFSSGRTHAIGLVNSHSDWIFEGVMGEIASAFTDSLRDLGYHLVLVPVDEESRWQELLIGGRLDGIAILHHYPKEAQQFLLACGLPTVLLGDSTEETTPKVIFDDHQGAVLATKHLVELGHRRIAFYIEQKAREHHSVTDRIDGYQYAMEKAGLGKGDVWRVSREELASRLVAHEDAPTAMVCYCHVEAQLLAHTLWRSGRSIPSEMSVVAFNDLPLVENMSPPLTTIGFDTQESGRVGAQMLASLINGDRPAAELIKITPHLVLRESTSPRKP